MTATFGYSRDQDGWLRPQLGYGRAPRHLWTRLEQTAFDSGAAFAIQTVIDALNNRICFDHQANNTCGHRECFANLELINLFTGKNQDLFPAAEVEQVGQLFDALVKGETE